MQEPTIKRAIAFVDGQNLFRAAKEAFNHYHPNYDLVALHRRVCEMKDWEYAGVYFYTGVPSPEDDPFWHAYWQKRLLFMKRAGIKTFTRRLQIIGGRPREKGIDVRISLDVIRLALENAYDVAVIYSQDQDLSEVAEEIRYISKMQNRWIKIASAYPYAPHMRFKKGIDKTDWIPIEENIYNSCIDYRDYRPSTRP